MANERTELYSIDGAFFLIAYIDHTKNQIVVEYGAQVERFENSPAGMRWAMEEFQNCAEHLRLLEKHS
jgi:hypothetical protein